MHEALVNRLGGLSLPRKSVVRLTDRPDMTLDVYRGRKTTMQQQQQCYEITSQAFSKAKLVSYYVTGYYVTSSCQSESRAHTQKRSTMTKESSEGELLKKKMLITTGKGLKNYRRQTLSMKR